eukprot:TRINITY_DN1294_c0_g1_i2.p2 TRINITY_DN1294_c0_g1~~TRINITY_DN1294_c0_g1_i2.p2  ORF type:complete len:282 (-),score=69.40 TRINITY_DN1294_c0_g1_i2:82-852(-)
MVLQRQRALAPLLACAAAAWAALQLAGDAFVGTPMPAPGQESVGRVVNVARGFHHLRKLERSHALQPKFITAKDKQQKIAKTRTPGYDRKKKIGPVAWPVEIPQGVTMLHVEYYQMPERKSFGQDWEAQKRARRMHGRRFPSPRVPKVKQRIFRKKPWRHPLPAANEELEIFYAKMQKKFGGKVRILFNQPGALKDLSPTGTGTPRLGSWEVVNLNTGEVLFSKLQHGRTVSLVYGDKVWWDSFEKKLEENVAQAA